MTDRQLVWMGCGCALVGVLADLFASDMGPREMARFATTLAGVLGFATITAVAVLGLVALSCRVLGLDWQRPPARPVAPRQPGSLPRARLLVRRDGDRAPR